MIVSPAVDCPSCHGNRCVDRGALPAGDFFAGRWVEPSLPGGSLYSCETCHLWFRWPRLTQQEMDALYFTGSETNWDAPSRHRRDWSIANAWIQQAPDVTSVLDVACFDGRFLENLPNGIERFGVEIQPDAAERARLRHVQIIGGDFKELASCERRFSVVTAFDILEHTHEPLKFLSLAIDKLDRGGRLIIGTGNTDSWSWRLMGNHYWYCSTVEHISFINPDWCQHAADQLGLSIASMASLSHGKTSVSKRFRETTMNLSYRVVPDLTRRTIASYRALVRSKKRTTPSFRPVWHSAKDHLLVMFRKEA